MRILAVSPHPDDVDVGCSGFLIRAHEAGHHIDLVVVTDGQTGGDPVRRHDEQILAANHYGAITEFLSFVDSRLVADRDLVDRLQLSLEQADPDLILIPWADDTHQDHRAVAEAMLSAARYRPSILAYETPTSVNFEPTLYVDISTSFGSKARAVGEHHTQIDKPRDIVTAVQATAAFRGWHARTIYAEGYRAIRLTLNGAFGLV